MAYLSPGVYIKEIDNSAIVPTVSNSTAFFSGNFTKGPIEQPFVVTNKAELEYFFGKPTNSNYNEWFQCSKYFDYSNQLVISRAFTEGNIFTSDIPIEGGISEGNDVFNTNSIKDMYVGTVIGFNKVPDQYTITDISYNDTAENYIVTFEQTPDENGETNGTGFLGSVNDGSMIDIYAKHQNAGIDTYQNIWDKYTLSEEIYQDYNQDFDLYKNKDDFEFKVDQISFPTYHSNHPLAAQPLGVKLKWFAQTAGGVNNGIEIAIINPYDFNDYIDPDSPATKSTKAEIFGVSILEFFEYLPQDDEVGIVIKQGDTTESYIVSFDQASLDGNNKSMYIETVINETSKLVYVADNLAMDKTTVIVKFGRDDITNNPSQTEYQTYVSSFLDIDSQGIIADAYIGGTPWDNPVYGTLSTFGGEHPSVTVGDIKNGYNEVLDKELYQIDIIIGNEVDEGDSAISLAKERADCIAFIGARAGDVLGKKSAVATNNLVDYMKSSTAPERTMFAAFFGNYHRIYDNFGKKFRWINVAGDMAGLRANTNTNRASWWASAGLRRGVIRNIDKLAFSPSLPQRDSLYKNNINPLVNFPGEGNLCWGQKTLLNYASSFDRVNVRGLFNTIERAMAKAAKSSVFEFNDPFTRNAILAMFNPYLSGVKAGRGISDFLVICDNSNNTPDVISRNELVVDIYIKPAYAAEFIQLTFNNVGTRSFSSVIGA